MELFLMRWILLAFYFHMHLWLDFWKLLSYEGGLRDMFGFYLFYLTLIVFNGPFILQSGWFHLLLKLFHFQDLVSLFLIQLLKISQIILQTTVVSAQIFKLLRVFCPVSLPFAHFFLQTLDLFSQHIPLSFKLPYLRLNIILFLLQQVIDLSQLILEL